MQLLIAVTFSCSSVPVRFAPNRPFLNMSLKALPLDESLYSLDEDEDALDFFKAQTRINGNEELKRHILAVQEKAYRVQTIVT